MQEDDEIRNILQALKNHTLQHGETATSKLVSDSLASALDSVPEVQNTELFRQLTDIPKLGHRLASDVVFRLYVFSILSDADEMGGNDAGNR